MSEHHHNTDWKTGDAALSRRRYWSVARRRQPPVLLPTLVSCSAPAVKPPGVPPLGDFGAGLLGFTDGSAALSADTTVHGACQFCNCLCRLTIGMKAGRVIDIRGERADPVQDGNLCVKAR